MTRCRLQAIVAADTIAFLLFGIWIERFESSFRARRLWYSVDMKGIKRLEKAEILKTAMRIVEGAKKSVKVTMLAKEEIRSPLPAKYFSLLKKKMASGVRVTRVGFGSNKEFTSLKTRVEIKSKNYQFYSVPKAGYQRMLLIDDAKLMYANTAGKKQNFFYTEDPETVRKYGKYFKNTCR